MPAAAVLSEIGDAATIKISGKRQITIPSAAQKKYGFKDYALCTFTEEGILISPLELTDDSEDLSVALLRFLVSEGYEGDELISKYAELGPKFFDYSKRVREADSDYAGGRIKPFDQALTSIKEKHGL